MKFMGMVFDIGLLVYLRKRNIFLIGIKDNRGFEKVMAAQNEDEEKN